MNDHDSIKGSENAASSSQPLERSALKKHRPFSLRGFTSLLLTLAFLVMCFSGIMLFVTPRGRFAHWNDWTLIGLGKDDWSSVHVNNSVLFVVIAALHLVLNWSVFVRYLKSKAVAGLNMKKELALASVIAAVCLAGPIYEFPPFSSLMALNEDIKDYWEQDTGAGQQAALPPVPHAEEFTLSELAQQIGLSDAQVVSALSDQGYEVSNASVTVAEVGASKNVAPSVVFAAIREKHPESRGWGRLNGAGQSSGESAEKRSGGGAQRQKGGDEVGEEKTTESQEEAGHSTHSGQNDRRGRGFGGGGGGGYGRGMGPGGGGGMGMGHGMGRGRGQQHTDHANEKPPQDGSATDQ